MSELARLDVERRGTVCVVRIQGEIDVTNARELSAAIEAAVPNGGPALAVDLTETTYLDSAGVQLLFLLAERLRTRRQWLRLIVPEESPIRAVLELTGLPKVIPLEGSLEDGPAGGES